MSDDLLLLLLPRGLMRSPLMTPAPPKLHDCR